MSEQRTWRSLIREAETHAKVQSDEQRLKLAKSDYFCQIRLKFAKL